MLRSLVVFVALVGVVVLVGSDSHSTAAHRKPLGSVPSIGGCIDFSASSCSDSDRDGYIIELELDTGSDPNDPNSTPEYGLLDEQFPPHKTCHDGIDNDLDGLTDRRDPGCRVTCWRFQPGPSCTDRDHDGWIKYMEVGLGSDPNDRLSTPEAQGSGALANACSDGIDNDRDGFIDAADPSCVLANCIDFEDPIPIDCGPI